MCIEVDSGYLLTPLAKLECVRDTFANQLRGHEIKGTLIVAPEGLNWSLSGLPPALAHFATILHDMNLPGTVRSTRTRAASQPFSKLKLRVRAELVTSGLGFASLPAEQGTHLAPEDFNELIERPGTRLIDVRNRYEIEIGTFPGAESPETENFTEFQSFVEETLEDADKSTPLALCCTGGIRCERASQLLLRCGFKEVYQLDGGILAYLQRLPFKRQRFTGECFVFDGRVSLTRDLARGSFDLNGAEIVRATPARAPAKPTP